MYIQPNVEVVILQGGYLCQQGSAVVDTTPVEGGISPSQPVIPD